MKEKILELRAQGLSYNKIVKELGCSKATVAYHCNTTTKNKTTERSKNDPNTLLIKRLSFYKNKISTFGFDRLDMTSKPQFTYKDVIKKYGENTNCYLTGTPINLITDNYQFDHIIPKAKGGNNSIDNLGITLPEANRSKTDLTIDEYIELCKKVLIHNGYEVTKI